MRALWAAVVLQATDDLDQHPYDSVIWSQAFAFFTAGGPWAESRQNIADCLDLHIDDLTRLGRATCAARAARDGGRAADTPAFVSPAPPAYIPPADSAAKPAASVPLKRDKNWWIMQFLSGQVA